MSQALDQRRPTLAGRACAAISDLTCTQNLSAWFVFLGLRKSAILGVTLLAIWLVISGILLAKFEFRAPVAIGEWIRSSLNYYNKVYIRDWSRVDRGP